MTENYLQGGHIWLQVSNNERCKVCKVVVPGFYTLHIRLRAHRHFANARTRTFCQEPNGKEIRLKSASS